MDYKPTLARLIALPTPTTIRRFRDILAQPPLKLDPFETLHVTVARALTPQYVEVLRDMENAQGVNRGGPENISLFRFTNFDYVYDEVLGASKLIGTLVCPALTSAHRLSETYDPNKSLVMQFLHAAPPLSNAIKSFVVSIADTLVLKEANSPFALDGYLHYVTEEDYTELYRYHYLGNMLTPHFRDKM